MGKYTVVFAGSPMQFRDNPMLIKSVFGPVCAIGYGNAFDDADTLRGALEEIEEQSDDEQAVALAREALDRVDATLTAALAVASAGEAS